MAEFTSRAPEFTVALHVYRVALHVYRLPFVFRIRLGCCRAKRVRARRRLCRQLPKLCAADPYFRRERSSARPRILSGHRSAALSFDPTDHPPARAAHEIVSYPIRAEGAAGPPLRVRARRVGRCAVGFHAAIKPLTRPSTTEEFDDSTVFPPFFADARNVSKGKTVLFMPLRSHLTAEKSGFPPKFQPKAKTVLRKPLVSRVTAEKFIFSRRTNRTHEARVYSHGGPIGHMMRGYILKADGGATMYCRAHGKEVRCARDDCGRVAAPGRDLCPAHGERPTCTVQG
eukprot:1194395-Prorocentrum_minimum.AAC.6